MKKLSWVRVLSMLLVVAMLTCCFAACGSSDEKEDATTAAPETSDAPASSTVPVTSDEPESSVEEPESSVEEPESSVEEPESSVEEPESSVEEPESSVEEPESSVEEPESSVEEPESSVEEPESSVEEPESSEEDPDASEEEPEETLDPDEEEMVYLPADADYGRLEFKIFAGAQSAWGLPHYLHIEGLEGDGVGVNDALYERELLLEDIFGVLMTIDVSRGDDALATYLTAQAKSGKYFADQIFMTGINTMNAAQKGELVNLLTLEELNLKASYYDQRIQQNYRMNDMLFQMSGDFDTIDELVTFGLLYNHKLYEDYGFNESEGTPYEMVRDYKWTYAKMMELAAPVTINMDSQFDIDDTVGIVSEDQAGYYFFLGSGLTPITNASGKLTSTFSDSTIYAKANEVLAAITEICTDASFCIPYRDFASDAPLRDSSANKEMFIGDRALFRSSSLSTTLNGMPEMESDFGILPIPMYQESQREYFCSLNDNANRPLVIPRHVEDLTTVAEITEIISYYSRYGGDESLYESFFERLTLAKICRTEDDRAMLTLIFNSKVYDMDRMLDILGMHTKVTSYVGGGCKSDITSTLDGVLATATKKIDAKVKIFNKNNG